MIITFADGQGVLTSYAALIDYTRREGVLEASRAGDTLNMPPVILSYQPQETVQTARFNPALAFVEVCQILAGKTVREAIDIVAPQTYKFGFFDRSNVEYGERVGCQIPRMINELKQSPPSRRVFAMAGQGDEDPEERPCALSVQLRIRGDELHWYTSMRSWDLARGLPYNVMMWGIPAQIVAQQLQLPKARVHIYATSPHLYVEDKDVEVGIGPAVRINTTYPAFWGWYMSANDELHKEVPWCEDCRTTSWHRKPTWITVEGVDRPHPNCPKEPPYPELITERLARMRKAA